MSSITYESTPWKAMDVLRLGFSDPMARFLRLNTPMYKSGKSIRFASWKIVSSPKTWVGKKVKNRQKNKQLFTQVPY